MLFVENVDYVPYTVSQWLLFHFQTILHSPESLLITLYCDVFLGYNRNETVIFASDNTE